MVSKFRIEEARIAPMVTVNITDHWLEFTARFVVDYQRRRATRDAIMRDLLIAFDANHKKVEFGSVTFELAAAPAVLINLKGENDGESGA